MNKFKIEINYNDKDADALYVPTFKLQIDFPLNSEINSDSEFLISC